MLPLRYTRRWQAAGIVLLAGVLLATLVPNIWFWSNKVHVPSMLSDKWLHGLTFAFLAVWFSGQYRRSSYWRLALGLVIFGALIEVVQSMVSYRTAEWLDLAADGIGIVAGLTIAMLGVGGWSAKIESWLQQRVE